MTLAKKVDAFDHHPDDEIGMTRNGMYTDDVRDLHQGVSAQQMVRETPDGTAAAVVIVTHVGRGADRLDGAGQGADLQGETEMIEDDPVVGRLPDATIITAPLGGRGPRIGAAHTDQNIATGHVLPGVDAQNLALAQGVPPSPDFEPNLARGLERGNDLDLRVDGQEVPTEEQSGPGPDPERAV